jgi:hypothetical protein
MDYDSFKTDRDDVVRDGADFETYRRPGALIDSDHPKITDYASRVAGEGNDRGKRRCASTTRCATGCATILTTRR